MVFERLESVMEIAVEQLIKLLQKVADGENDSTADHVLMALARIDNLDTVDDVVTSVLSSVADGLGVPLV